MSETATMPKQVMGWTEPSSTLRDNEYVQYVQTFALGDGRRELRVRDRSGQITSVVLPATEFAHMLVELR